MRYEYKVLSARYNPDELEAKLNEFGKQGFKLVAVTETFTQDGETTGDSLYLMREAIDNP